MSLVFGLLIMTKLYTGFTKTFKKYNINSALILITKAFFGLFLGGGRQKLPMILSCRYSPVLTLCAMCPIIFKNPEKYVILLI